MAGADTHQTRCERSVSHLMSKLAWLRLAAGLVVLGFFLAKTATSDAVLAVSQAKVGLIVLAIAINVPILALVGIRSGVLLRRLGYKPPLGIVLSATTVGYVLGALTPAATGEFLRVQALNHHAGLPVRTGVTLVAFERLVSFYLLCLSTLLVGAVIFLPWQIASLLSVMLLGATVLPAYAGAFLRLVPECAEGKPGIRAGAYRLVRRCAADVDSMARDRIALLSTSALTVAIFALVALQFSLVAESIGVNVSYLVAWLGFGTSQVAGIASMLPIGTSDASLAAVLHGFKVSAESALVVALLVRAALILPLLAVAAVAHVALSLPQRQPEASAPMLAEES